MLVTESCWVRDNATSVFAFTINTAFFRVAAACLALAVYTCLLADGCVAALARFRTTGFAAGASVNPFAIYALFTIIFVFTLSFAAGLVRIADLAWKLFGSAGLT
jgi:hypothetical protein